MALRASTGSVLWTYEAEGGGVSAPLTVAASEGAVVCCAGVLLIPTVRGVLHAVGLADGYARWAYTSEARLGVAGISGGAWMSPKGSSVLFGGLNGFIHSLKALSGDIEWRYSAGDLRHTLDGDSEELDATLLLSSSSG